MDIYQQYAYSYPHKLAYREFDEPLPLKEVWRTENRTTLFAYLHIPYCEMRCGFCNLFTIANPKQGLDNYLAALRREALTYKAVLPDIQFEEYAIGGGTPTFLDADQLAKMLAIFKNDLSVDTLKKYGSIESSPKSITPEKIQLIESYGINRISIGIQSWIEEETKQLGRPQSSDIASQAVERLMASRIPEVNIDLIYGIKGQTARTWQYALEKTLVYAPTEIFLYPLYTRPLTGLAKLNGSPNIDNRLPLYRQGRDYLLTNGYRQVSMRCFRRVDAPIIASEYDSTTNGMVGIGAGARSYTSKLHYSGHYAVSRKAIKGIIEDYSNQQDFTSVHYGIHLNEEEEIRRFLIKSLIDGGQLSEHQFEGKFNQSVLDLEVMQDFFNQGFLVQDGDWIKLSKRGLELEDWIGPQLFSSQVNDRMNSFQLI
ncbi:MAG: coproporphyrinogen III oxidase family protein [Cyanothece sp. SIO1E1]|nr:coproporphyrinogen III oxidase family protein [Cyanothece sp. SIO1E1]